MTNVTFLVADADLAAEELLIGLPLLRHLGANTKTLLERQREKLGGSDCSIIKRDVRGGSKSWLMIARLNRIVSPVDATPISDAIRPRLDYFESKE